MSDKYILRCIAEAACELLMQEIDKANANIVSLKSDHEKEELKLWDDNRSLSIEVARLKAEVERLRFAGDVLAFTLAHGDRMEYGDPSEPIEEYMNRLEIKEWNAAKEGNGQP